MIDSVGRRERKKSQTTAALRAAALRLVAQRGLANVTVADIADTADVSSRTFFNHFASKEDALVGMEGYGWPQLKAALEAQGADLPPLAALQGAFVRMVTDLSPRYEELLLQMRVYRANPELKAREAAEFARYERQIVADVARRSGTDAETDLYPLLVTRAAIAALRSAIARWRDAADRIDLPASVADAFAQLERGLPPPR